MGAIKDIYDIFAKVSTEMEARRLHERKERSREEAIAYATTLEERITELKVVVENLEREHTEEVADLKTKNQELVATNEQLVAKIKKLENPDPPSPPNTVGTPYGF
jgi:cell division protein FtsB